MKKTILSAAVLIAGVWAIIAAQQGDFNAYKILKPLTTILIILIALFSSNQENKIYNKYITIALCFCLIGDIFLLSNAWFLFGLASFLIAHLFFIYTFSTVYGFSKKFIPLLVLSIVYVAYFIYLMPYLKSFALPVAFYMIAIIVMNWQAVALYFKDKQKVSLLIAFAAILFTFSDSMVAYNKFKEPFELADILILSTYWLAIYVFAFTSQFVKNRPLL